MDLNSTFEPAQCYVMLSRIQQIDQLFILNSLNKKKIRMFPKALEELKRLRSISYNKNPTPWSSKDERTLKVAFLNCAGLRGHIKDIKNDAFLLHSNVLEFVETSVPNNANTSELEIDGYNSHFLNIGRGRGAATYIQNKVVSFSENFTAIGIQISKFTSNDLCLLSIYRSQNGNIGSLLESLASITTSQEKAVLITGDFNVCNIKKPNNVIKSSLVSNGFRLLVFESTQILGGSIDHAYWRDPKNVWEVPVVERYSPYYSDHDALCITLKSKVSKKYSNIFFSIIYLFRKHCLQDKNLISCNLK